MRIVKLDIDFFFCVLWVIHRNPAVENQAVDRIVSFHLFSFQMNEEENYRRMKKKASFLICISFCSPTASVGSNKTRFFDKVHHFTFH